MQPRVEYKSIAPGAFEAMRVVRNVLERIEKQVLGRETAWLLIKKQDLQARKGWKTPVVLTASRLRSLKERMPACAVE